VPSLPDPRRLSTRRVTVRGSSGASPLAAAPAPAPASAVTRRSRTAAAQPRIVVVGDLVLDVVLVPDRDLERGTDVTGGVRLRQGGSASTTARWLGDRKSVV
jgi:hypothetical protein